MATFVEVTGPIFRADNAVTPYRRLEFSLRTWDKQGNQVIQQTVTEAILTSVGQFSVNLWSTTTGAKGLAYGVTAFWWSDALQAEQSELLGYIAPGTVGPYFLGALLTAIAPTPIPDDLLAQITAAAATATAAAAAAAASAASVDTAALNAAIAAAAASATAASGSAVTALGHANTALGYANTALGYANTAAATLALTTTEANRASRQVLLFPNGVPPRAANVIDLAKRVGGVAIDFVNRRALTVQDPALAIPAESRPDAALSVVRTSTAKIFGPDRRLATIAANVLPYSHDPSTGKPLGFYPNSAFTQIIDTAMSAWTVSGQAVPVAAEGLGGAATGWQLRDDASAGGHTIQRAAVTVSGSSYLALVAVKAETIGAIRLAHSGTTDAYVDFDASTGRVITAGAAATPLGVIALPNGWFIVGFFFVSTSTGGVYRISMLSDAVGAGTTYTGTGAGTILVSEPALTLGFRRMYQPVSARTEDQVSMSLAGMPWSNAIGAVTIRAKSAPTDGSVHTLLDIRNVSTSARIYIRASSTTLGVYDSGSGDSILAPLENSENIVVSLRWDAFGIEVYVNGKAFGTLANTWATVNPDRVQIGWGSAGQNWDAEIESLYFGKAWLDFADLYDLSEARLVGAVGVIGTTPNRKIVIFQGSASFPLTDGDGDNYDPIFDPALREIRWTNVFKTVTRTKRFPIDFRSVLRRSPHRDVDILIGGGQSRSAMINGGPVVTVGNINNPRAVMFTTGARLTGTGYAGEVNTLVPEETLTNLIAAKAVASGRSGEIAELRMAQDYLATDPTNEKMVVFNSAIGSSAFAEHVTGEEVWANESAAIARIAFIAWRQNTRLKRMINTWDQGDGDAADSVVVYGGKLLSKHDANEARWQYYRDWQTAQGFADPGKVITILRQFAVSTVNNTVPEAYAYALRNRGTRSILIALPTYIIPSNGFDGHYLSSGAVLAGAFQATALLGFVANAAWDCLRPLSGVRVGAVITVTLNTAAPNLTMPVVIDTTLVNNHADGRYGVSVFNSVGTKLTVNSVTVNGSNQLVVTLAAVPPAGVLTVKFGLNPESTNKQGPQEESCRTNIRDSTAGNYVVGGVNQPKYNWLILDSIAVA